MEIATITSAGNKPNKPLRRNPLDLEEAFAPSILYRNVLLHKVLLPDDDGRVIVDAICLGTARAISNGSFLPDDQKGLAAFIITPGETINDKMISYNLVPGYAPDQNAYRSELCGIDGVLSALEVITNYHQIEAGGITLALDGKSALQQAANDEVLYAGQSSFDVIQDIHHHI